MSSSPAPGRSGHYVPMTTSEKTWSVTAHLSGYVVARQVNQDGMVSIYDRGYHVGRAHQGKSVYVTFDPETNEWVFSDPSGRELRHEAAEEISPERALALNVIDRRQ